MTTVDLSAFIRAYDVRGLVTDQLTPSVCRALGSAFARVIVVAEGHERIVLGHDMRASSPVLADAFAAGVRSGGVGVTLVGLCASDQLYFATGVLDCPGAMITASHNPAAYNGIKLCRSKAVPVGMDSGLALVRDLAQRLLDGTDPDHHPDRDGPGPVGPLTRRDMLADYAAYLRSLVDLAGLRPLRVVVDAGNGMAGLTAPAVLCAPGLPLEVIGLYDELDGTFPNHEANPLDPANLVDLREAVRAHGADLGLAFDGDADRCFVVDEQGEPVSASAITALVAAREIAAEISRGVAPSEVSVVHTTISSRAVVETVRELGARPVRARVGHSFVKAEMARSDAVFGGEHSGHFYFRDFWRADTGMLAALHVLASLGSDEDMATMSSTAAPFERYSHSGEINARVDDVGACLDRVRGWGLRCEEEEVVVDDLDGLSLFASSVTGAWWTVSVRSSNTEPLVRLNVEAADEATMTRVRDTVAHLVTTPSATG